MKYPLPLAKKISIASLSIGGDKEVLIQSMTNTDTNDVEGSFGQSLRIIDAGGQMVRLTVQGKREVDSIGKLIALLKENHIETPIVADVHFNAKVAEAAAEYCHKIRINPGNFTEKQSAKSDYSDAEFEAGLEENRRKLISLLKVCKKHNTALRIGVNHGSLSKRIMARFGDTPEGMVESAMEFLRICKEYDFENIAVSLKSSNARVMVQSVRLLTLQMIREDLYYPVHLGVTEAGDGLEGRIKSVVGIAPLLLEGIGDTIRVSLTEAPENEIPVASSITKLFPKPSFLEYKPFEELPWNPFHYSKPETLPCLNIGGSNPPRVFSKYKGCTNFIPDGLIQTEGRNIWLRMEGESYPLNSSDKNIDTEIFHRITLNTRPETLHNTNSTRVYILDSEDRPIQEIKHWLIDYYTRSLQVPIILQRSYSCSDKDLFALQAGGEFASLLIDGLIDGIWIENPELDADFLNWLSFYILQASRARISSTDYIACPSCGRTLFDIQSVLAEVKAATSHLKGLKIAVMGCIVNGPGEMADADFGYVGMGKGQVSLYKGKERVVNNIPSEDAVQKLLDLIRENGLWKDP